MPVRNIREGTRDFPEYVPLMCRVASPLRHTTGIAPGTYISWYPAAGSLFAPSYRDPIPGSRSRRTACSYNDDATAVMDFTLGICRAPKSRCGGLDPIRTSTYFSRHCTTATTRMHVFSLDRSEVVSFILMLELKTTRQFRMPRNSSCTHGAVLPSLTSGTHE